MQDEEKRTIQSLNEDEKFYKLFKKLNDMEQQIANLVHPIQSLSDLMGQGKVLSEFTENFRNPIKVDSYELCKTLSEFNHNLENYARSTSLAALISAFSEISRIMCELRRLDCSCTEMSYKINRIYENGVTLHVNSGGERLVPEIPKEEPKKPKKKIKAENEHRTHPRLEQRN